MFRNLFVAAAVAVLGSLLTPAEASAWGVGHVGYTHVGPGGVYHAGRTAVAGPYGYHVGGTAGYRTVGGYGAGYHYGATGAYGVGGYHYGAAAGYAGGYRAAPAVAVGGVYRRW